MDLVLIMVKKAASYEVRNMDWGLAADHDEVRDEEMKFEERITKSSKLRNRLHI